MRKYLVVVISLFGIYLASAQPQDANFFYDNGSAAGSYTNATSFDETQMFAPAAPGKLEKVYVFFAGTTANRDTLRIVKDPTDGYTPSTWWVSGLLTYSTYVSIPFDYPGEPGWYEFDVSDYNIEIGGLNRVGVQHLIKSGGPYFTVDTDGRTDPLGPWITDVFTPNPEFYNIAGSMVSQAQADFIIRLKVDWKYGEEGALPPEPTLVDVTTEAKLLNNEGNFFSSPMLTVHDLDGDGWEDVIIGNTFLRNENGEFIDVSDQYAEIAGGRKTFGDLDGDGVEDIVVAAGQGNDFIYYGSTTEGYSEQTPSSLQKQEPITTVLLLDYDADGLLDIFVARGRTSKDGQETYYHDQLLRNLGNRDFEDVSISSGIRAGETTALDCWGASVADYNNDNLPDIFVATYRLAPDLLYENQGDGTFVEVGVLTKARGIPTAYPDYFGHGMGSDWGDYDNDGDMDLVVGNLSHPDSRGSAANPSYVLANTETGFEWRPESSPLFFEMNAGTTWIDIDNDGLLDLFSAQYAYYKKGQGNGQPDKNSRIYRNLGVERDYAMQDITWESGMRVHGAWTGYRIDYDHDGDLDILVASNQEHIKLFENRMSQQGNSIIIDPRIEGENHVYGKTIELQTSGGTYIRQLMGSVSTGRDGKQSDFLHFGIGDETPELITLNLSDGYEISAPITESGFFRLGEIFSTSVEHSDETTLNVFPQPAIDILNIDGLLIEKTEYTVANLEGKIVLSGILDNGQLDISSLAKGSYYLELGSLPIRRVSFVKR